MTKQSQAQRLLRRSFDRLAMTDVILKPMLTIKLEAILFAIAKPIATTQLSKQLNVSLEVVHEAIDEIKKRFNKPESGIHLIYRIK